MTIILLVIKWEVKRMSEWEEWSNRPDILGLMDSLDWRGASNKWENSWVRYFVKYILGDIIGDALHDAILVDIAVLTNRCLWINYTVFHSFLNNLTRWCIPSKSPRCRWSDIDLKYSSCWLLTWLLFCWFELHG